MMSKNRLYLLYPLLIFIIIGLTSCIELTEIFVINKDGSGYAKFRISIRKEYANMVIPQVKQELLKEKKDWTIVEEKQEDGKQLIIVGRHFKDIQELNDEETQYTLKSQENGFLKKSYLLKIKQLKMSKFPHEFIVKMPGDIAFDSDTNGTKVSSNEVKWTYQGLQRGTELSVKSSVSVIPLPVVVLAGGASILIIFLVVRKMRTKTVPEAPMNSGGDVVFCIQCGQKNAASSSFCIKCGTKMG